MKEIGKLIELLNEYHHFNSDLIYYGWDEEYEKVYFHSELPEKEKEKLRKAGIDMEDEGIDEQRIGDEWICSKKFGFIKWLVENEKIDYINPRQVPNSTGYVWVSDDVKKSDTEIKIDNLIMLLAIQDEPIRFLCEILK